VVGSTTSTSTTTSAPTGEPIVLEGESDQVFPKKSFSGDYAVSWSYRPNSAPFLSVDALQTANPDAFGKTVIDTEAAQGTTIVHLEGEYYMNVSVGGRNYTITFTPQ
jgi:hypothetical protein